MSEVVCPGCLQRDATIQALLLRIDALEARVRDLEERLGRNASNSSVPPSAAPPGAPPAVTKKPTGRRRGGQKGHKGHSRVRLPADRLSHVIPLVPRHCERCRAPLPAQPGPDDPPPSWHQVAELPRVSAVVSEFQGHARTCLCCRHVTRETIPAAITAHAFGPRLGAAIGYLAACQHVSVRGLQEVVQTLFGVPVALGTIAALHKQLGQALKQPHGQIAQAARQAFVKNVDETGWKLAGLRHWLWVAVSSVAIFFLVRRHRNAQSLQALLGARPAGIIGTDRFGAYNLVPDDRRQLCWAHLKRDFQAMLDRGNAGSAIGAELLWWTRFVFADWRRWRQGQWTREQFRQEVSLTRTAIHDVLRRGAACGCAKTAGVCAALLAQKESLWVYAEQPGVEPTNNAAERALRRGVLWRKRSFGSQSEEGCRFVERLLSVTATLRLHGRQVLDYLADALTAHRHGLPAPPVLPTG